MKISISIDCTPEEARAFFGLPDVKPMQEALLKAMQDQMIENVARLDPSSLMQSWLPTTLRGFEELQKTIFRQMQPGGAPPSGKKDKG